MLYFTFIRCRKLTVRNGLGSKMRVSVMSAGYHISQYQWLFVGKCQLVSKLKVRYLAWYNCFLLITHYTQKYICRSIRITGTLVILFNGRPLQG